MSHWWETIEKVKERYGLAQWVVVTFVFLFGLFINATYQLIDWIMVPFNNQKDITILLEKSEEFTTFFDSVKNIQSELQQSRTDNQKLREDLNNLSIEFKGQFRRLEDGQLQLFLKTERLDERTQRK